MRKISIGIFAVATVTLFLLSASISVTATLHEEKLMILTSGVQESVPQAYVQMAPQNVWSYSNWNWTVDVNDGDDIIINTDCICLNDNSGSGTDTGVHEFLVWAHYEHDSYPDRWDEDPKLIKTDSGQDDSDTMTIEFTNINEGAYITLCWSVVARNEKFTPPPVSNDDHYGFVTLT